MLARSSLLLVTVVILHDLRTRLGFYEPSDPARGRDESFRGLLHVLAKDALSIPATLQPSKQASRPPGAAISFPFSLFAN